MPFVVRDRKKFPLHRLTVLFAATLYAACAGYMNQRRVVDCNVPEILVLRDSVFLKAVERVASFNKGRVPILLSGPFSTDLLSDPNFTIITRDDVVRGIQDTAQFYYVQLHRSSWNADTVVVSTNGYYFYTRNGHRLSQGDGVEYVVRRSGTKCTYGTRILRVQ